jgi:hypothetical protein
LNDESVQEFDVEIQPEENDSNPKRLSYLRSHG